MTRRVFVIAVAALLAAVTPLAGIYMRVESRRVPVDRLVANLERELKANPKDVPTIINLARLHAMAYALKEDDFPGAQMKPDQPELPSYAPGSSQVPATIRPATSAEHAKTAAGHLDDAIRHYAAALALAPDNLTARLGHGWALQQAGNSKAAIAEYRKVIELAWPGEQKIKTLMPSQRLFTQEAAGYLIPLLDKERDAAEIADLRAKQSELAGRPRAITPIAIPLSDGATPQDFVNQLARVRFDADGTSPRDWTWITPDAGWLVYDADGRGEIDSALQLFGNVTFWLFWSNGYDALRALDDDGDGELAAGELRNLRIWHDRDSDGISDPSEVVPLAAHGIVALSVDYTNGDGRRVAALSAYGARLANGRTRPTYDVILNHAASTWTRR